MWQFRRVRRADRPLQPVTPEWSARRTLPDYCNLGSVYRTRGDTAKTRQHWTKARDLYKSIGMTDQAQGVQGWLDILPPDKP